MHDEVREAPGDRGREPEGVQHRLRVRRDVRGVRRPVRGEAREAAAGPLPPDHRQHGALVGPDRGVEAVGSRPLPRRVPDHARVVDPRGARAAQGIRRADVPGRGRDRGRGRAEAIALHPGRHVQDPPLAQRQSRRHHRRSPRHRPGDVQGPRPRRGVVAIGDLDGDTAEAAALDLAGGSIGLALDVTDRAAFTAFLDEVERRLGPIDILVNNAGIMPWPRSTKKRTRASRASSRSPARRHPRHAGGDAAHEAARAPGTSSTSRRWRAAPARPAWRPTARPSTP